MDKVFEVSEITKQIKQTLEDEFDEIAVIGEISNYKAHVSGHWYFTIKDSNAQISCTMWRGLNSYVFFTPQDGMRIIVFGRITVYPPRGSYQIEVRSMKPAGEGELQAAFEKLKRKLSAEGLFDTEYKKNIPQFPVKIGIVTAPDGAAVRDMISVAKRRYPVTELVIYPTKVQGKDAAESIAAGIKYLNSINEISVIIIGRGGGSLEDLWAFNEEVVARAVFDSTIPIISGVGHEIDFTISDFVADLRAPTPTAAMELATPNIDELIAFMNEFSYNITKKILELISSNRNAIRQLLNSYGFKLPQDLINNRVQLLDNLVYRNNSSIDSKLKYEISNLKAITDLLNSMNPNNILKRGYTLVKQSNKIIKRSLKLNPKKTFSIKFFDNEIKIK